METNNYISKINLEGVVFDIKDETARTSVNNIIGTPSDDKNKQTIYGAKAYTESILTWETL